MVEFKINLESSEKMISILKKIASKEKIKNEDLSRLLQSDGCQHMLNHHIIIRDGELSNLSQEDMKTIIQSIAAEKTIEGDEKLSIIRESLVKTTSAIDKLEKAISYIKSQDIRELLKKMEIYFPKDYTAEQEVFVVVDGVDNIYTCGGKLIVDLIWISSWSDIIRNFSYTLFRYALHNLIRQWSQDFKMEVPYLLNCLILSLQLEGILSLYFSPTDEMRPGMESDEPRLFAELVYFKDIEHLMVRILDKNLIEREWRKNFFLLFYESDSGYVVGESMAYLIKEKRGEEAFLETMGTPFTLLGLYNDLAKAVNKTGREYRYCFNEKTIQRILALN